MSDSECGNGTPKATEQIARYLTLNFGGYFMCRLATDPDPSDDPQGTSGYTMALSDEPVLDQVIRLQPDPVKAPLRSNALPDVQKGVRDGVRVQSVEFDGAPSKKLTKRLKGARVDLLHDPVFVSRNNAVGSDDTMAFLVEPFHLRVTHERKKVRVLIDAVDDVIQGHPSIPSVDVIDPSRYARRLPVAFVFGNSPEANQAIGVYDEYGYFRDRRRWLAEKIEQADKAGECEEREGYKSRLFQIEAWGDRVINKLGFQASWSHRTNGEQAVGVSGESMEDFLGGTVVEDQPWAVSYWFGGWDGDLLVGYTRGSLSMPFVPA